MRDEEARLGLVRAMRRMHAAGLNRGTSGNASVRVEGGMLVTPSGIAPDALSAGSMVFVAADGTAQAGGLRPSSEFRMHHHILARRPDAMAVAHCHSRHATILACCGKRVEPIHYMVLKTGATHIPLAPFAVFGTEALAVAVVQTMGAGSACLLAHHGQVAIGPTLDAAVEIAEEVEEQAAVFFGALLLGGGAPLGEQALRDTVTQFGSYGQRKEAVFF